MKVLLRRYALVRRWRHAWCEVAVSGRSRRAAAAAARPAAAVPAAPHRQSDSLQMPINPEQRAFVYPSDPNL